MHGQDPTKHCAARGKIKRGIQGRRAHPVSGSVTDPAPRNLALSIAPAAVKSDNSRKG
jgi:hypothetical protein